MTFKELQSIIARGEDSSNQFKSEVQNLDALASEMVAFSNSDGGTIFIGVADDCSITGLELTDVARVNQQISNASSQHVRGPIEVITNNVQLPNGRIVIVITVPKGIDRPYFDRKGIIWTKCGADKRRINSREALQRLFQLGDQFHADELPTKAGIDKLDKLRFRDFLRDFHKLEYPTSSEEMSRLLQNMNLAGSDGKLNLAGVLLFAERPEWIKPQFVVKAIRYPGNEIHASDYIDTEDFVGPLRKIFDDSLAFIMRNLHKVQAGQGVNSPGTPEIPELVFEELLVNALVHRDYLVSAPIRLFIFDNRIEIISPGHLPNNLTVEKIRTGNSNVRNPILVSFVAKNILPYHGVGSGIIRALKNWPDITFLDDREGCLFTAIVYRASADAVYERPAVRYGYSTRKPKTSVKKSVDEAFSPDSPQETSVILTVSPKTSVKILEAIGQNCEVTIPVLATLIGVSERSIERNIQKLQQEGRLLRVGPDRGGRWEVIG
ncbi:MAG: RNA-binding domain-containing protein [bacterium]